MTITLNGIEIPNSLQWTDEFSQNKVSQTINRTLSGSAVVYNGQRKSGFPISLESGSDHGWVKRSVLNQIKGLCNQSGLIMSLNVRGESFSVLFDHSSENALNASPLIPYANPTDDDYYLIKCKFITV